MLNFILYEDEKKYREKYISVILKIVGSMKNAYKIVEIDKYDKNTMSKIGGLIGKKIFILSIGVPGKSGLDFAKEIRKSGDWESQMIVVTTHEHLKISILSSKLLMLDYISKYYNCEELLEQALRLSIDIVSSFRSLNFQINGEIIQIPYSDILFIEKNVEDIYSTVVTRNGRIPIRKSITAIETILDDESKFFRAHRSCIVNLSNITKIELKNSIICFGDIKTRLLSRNRKNKLKAQLTNREVVGTK